jgi:hypothetical protein
MAVFWVVAPCSLVEVYQRFRGPCCLHHQEILPDYTALQPRGQPSSYSPPWEPQILQFWFVTVVPKILFFAEIWKDLLHYITAFWFITLYYCILIYYIILLHFDLLDYITAFLIITLYYCILIYYIILLHFDLLHYITAFWFILSSGDEMWTQLGSLCVSL